MHTDDRLTNLSRVSWKYGGPVSGDAIQTFESEMNFEFPAALRKILIAHDGGRPQLQALVLPGGREVILERLLAVVSQNGTTISSANQALRSQGFQGLLPFATDPFGNLFCFTFQQEGEAGPILFWNHETGTTQRICGSFTDLLGLLCEPS